MASGTSDLIVRLSLDTTQFESSLSKFEGQMEKLQASCTNASTGIGLRIKHARNKKNMTQEQLADALGASRNQIVLLENGDRGVSLEIDPPLMYFNRQSIWIAGECVPHKQSKALRPVTPVGVLGWGLESICYFFSCFSCR